MSLSLLLASGVAVASIGGDHTPDPAGVTIAGSLQDELGCAGDWQPDCAVTHLAFDAEDTVWQATFTLPAGNWEYKAALNDSWAENYGANATPNGPNIGLSLLGPEDVKFYYSHETHWVTDDENSIIATAPGNYQSHLGCTSNWDAGCLRSWMQDPDGDGILSFRTQALPGGDYEVKAAINESWAENYGRNGVPDGPSIGFTLPCDGVEVLFEFDYSTKILTVSVAALPCAAFVPEPGSIMLLGSGLAGLAGYATLRLRSGQALRWRTRE